ncbi:MAG: C40 family peptidase [Robiginitomaculum sp.]|nr:C40 family peptidase [Robiginitomaculum sp.]
MDKPVPKLDTRITPYKPDLAASHLKDVVEAKNYGDAIRHQVMMPVIPLHKAPASASMMDTQLLLGAEFDIYDIHNGWAWGQEVVPDGNGQDCKGYVGYVPNMALARGAADPTHRISAIRAPVFIKPDFKTAIRTTLPLNAKLSVDGRDGNYMRIPDMGYVHVNHIATNSAANGDFVSVAELHIGLPYVWGGISPDGVDCSGLVQTALRATGQDALRDADMQEATLGIEIAKDTELKRGVLIFWKGHVGIMRSAQTLLHANAFHMQVASEPLVQAISRIEKMAGAITSIKRL